MHKKFAREGFTLIELTLSILFISILSLAVALLITNAITAYHRGIALSQINNVGMETVDDIRASIQNAQARSLTNECANFYEGDSDSISACESDQAHKFSSITKKADVENGGKNIGKVPVFGAFCTGSYSYIWNSGYFFNTADYTVDGVDKASLSYKDKDNKVQKIEGFRLLKVQDEEQEVCKSEVVKDTTKKVSTGYNIANENLSGHFDITKETDAIVEEDPVDILTTDIKLSVYDLSVGITTDSAARNNNLYSVSFILGTDQGGININVSGNYCAAPEDYKQSAVANFDYCSINKFNFVAQANGGTNAN